MHKCFALVAFGLLLALTLPPATRADVVVERTIQSGGFMGMGASESRQKEFLQGEKKRIDSATRFTGSLLGKLAGGERTACEIIRADKGVAWDLDHAAATWRERSLALGGDGVDKAGQAPALDEEQEEAAEETAMDEEEWRVVRNELKLDDTGEKKTLHGFPCRRYLLTWLVEAENLQTRERRTNRMTGDFWNTPVRGPVKALQEQERAFNAAYLKQLGLEMSPEQMGQFGLNLLGSLVAASSEELQQTLGRMQGYPIVAAISWQATEPAGDEKEEAAGGLDLSQGVGSALGGLFGKKLKEVATGKKKDGEMRTVFDSRTEIVAIDTAGIAPVQFEIPRSYRRRD